MNQKREALFCLQPEQVALDLPIHLDKVRFRFCLINQIDMKRKRKS